MTTNHPANGPVSLERLHQIREHLQHDTQYSNGGNRAYILADVLKVIDEVLERRKADNPPVHPTIADEKLDDETLRELIEFRRSTFEYHSKEGHKVQTIIHGVVLSALLELQERRAAMLHTGNSQVTPDGWIPVSERMPPQGVPLLVCSGNGVVQRTVYGFDGENWLDWYEQYDPAKAELDDLWQPLPAAPQQ